MFGERRDHTRGIHGGIPGRSLPTDRHAVTCSPSRFSRHHADLSDRRKPLRPWGTSMSRARLATLPVLLIVVLLLLTAGGSPSPSAAGGPKLKAHVPGELLVKFKPTARGLDRASAMA